MGANEKVEAALGPKPIVHYHEAYFSISGRGAFCGAQGVNTVVTMAGDSVTCVDCRAIVRIMEDDTLFLEDPEGYVIQYWRTMAIEVRDLIDKCYATNLVGLVSLEVLERIVDRHQQ